MPTSCCVGVGAELMSFRRDVLDILGMTHMLQCLPEHLQASTSICSSSHLLLKTWDLDLQLHLQAKPFTLLGLANVHKSCDACIGRQFVALNKYMSDASEMQLCS